MIEKLLYRIIFFILRHDFIPHSLDKPRSFKPEEVYVPHGEFDALTSYNKEYTRNIITNNFYCLIDHIFYVYFIFLSN